MKIAIGPIEGHYGGAAQHILNIMRNSVHDYETIEVPSSLQKWGKFFRKYVLPIQDVIPYSFLKHNPRRFDMYGWQKRIDFPGRTLAKKLQDVDVVHLHGHPYWEQVYDIKGPKIVFTSHNIYNKEDFSPSWGKTIDYLTDRMIEVCKRSNTVISVARWLQDSLKRNYEVDSEYIPNGVNLKEFDSRDGNLFRRKFGVEEDFYLFVGRATRYKRPELFLSLAQRLHQRKFVMVGRGITQDNLERYYKKEIPKNVICVGEPEREDVVNAFGAAKVFILPSSNETFGIVILEAMASKLPAVAANNLGPSEIIKDGETGFLFEPDNLESLVRRADVAWTAKEVGLAGRAEVEERYDWKKIVPEIENVYCS